MHGDVIIRLTGRVAPNDLLIARRLERDVERVIPGFNRHYLPGVAGRGAAVRDDTVRRRPPVDGRRVGNKRRRAGGGMKSQRCVHRA